MASRRPPSSIRPSLIRRILSRGRGLLEASLSRRGRLTWTAGGLGLGLGVLVAAIPAVQRGVEPPVDAVTVTFEHLPPWADASIREHVSGLALSRLAGTTLGRSDLQQVRSTLLNSGFFTSVDQVQRTGRQEVSISARLVTPLARIRDRHGTTMIDERGRLMPAGCRVSDAVHLVTIRHPRYSRPVRANQPWAGGDLAAALRVLQQIAPAIWIDQVEAIDLSRFAATGSLILVTDRGSQIVWGSAPGDERAMESLLASKITRLDELHRMSGRIDQYHPGEIDITDATVVYKR